jgi:tetratricopeptide (TPR) repeat protein
MLFPLLLAFQIAGELPVAPLPIPGQDGPLATTQPQAELSFDEARFEECLKQARTDPASAINVASQWAGEAVAESAAYPQQCLGHAYTSLLRWDAAERAFLTARETLAAGQHEWRARLALQAANAALAGTRADAALFDLSLAERDLGPVEAGADPGVAAMIETDRARALVAAGRESEAVGALDKARALDPQSPNAWLLSATLARRLGQLGEAQGYIEAAAKLAPEYPEIGLEAGVIAMLAGRQDAARASWQSVLALAPGDDAASAAKAYLAQLDELAKP